MKHFLIFALCGAALFCLRPGTAAAQNAGLNFVLVTANSTTVSFRAEMVTPVGVSFLMEAVYVAVEYDPTLLNASPASITDLGFAASGFSNDSRWDFEANGVNPDICLYGESHPNFGNVPIPQNAHVPLCRFVFTPKSASTPGTTSFCVTGNTPTAAITGYYVNTTSNNQVFTPAPCLQNVYFPVELSAFTATQQGGAVMLQWTTESETGNHGFQVLRRAAGSDEWIDLGFVAGNGTTRQQHHYIFLDQTLPAPDAYEYRLRQMDLDGGTSFSPVRRVQFNAGTPGFTLEQNYPNPVAASGASTQLRYAIPERATVRLTITDMLGRTVATLMDDVMDAGTYTRVWTPVNLPAGYYHATLEAQNERGSIMRTGVTISVIR